MTDTSAVRVNDVVVSRVPDGHDLFVVSGAPAAPVTVLYRGTDSLGSVEYLESFRVHAPERH